MQKDGLWLPLILGKNCKGKNKLHKLVMLKGPIDTLIMKLMEIVWRQRIIG